MSHNPLIIPILEILKQSHAEISEYDLIAQLEEQGIQFPVENDTYEMTMFKKHFMTMNALYHLQQDLVEDEYYLSITATRLRLEPSKQNTDSSLVEDGERKVRDYYLDWSQFDKTTQQDVEKLLNDFWKRYFAVDKQVEALQVLGLDDQCSWQDVQNQYRTLVKVHHPDKGGDQERFIEIREAYEILRHCLGQ